MKNNLAIFILFTTASVFASAIPADPTTLFDLAAEAAELAAPGSADSDPSISLEFQVGRHHRCYWSGTAPFCIGYCGHGYMEMRRNKCGNGVCCWAGSKALCCRRRLHIEPPTHGRPQRSHLPPSSPRQVLHAMFQPSTKKHDLSRYAEEGTQGDDEMFKEFNDDAFDELSDTESFGGSRGLSGFDHASGFGGSDEYELEGSQDEKGSEGMEEGGIGQFKKDSRLNDAHWQPEF